MKSEIVDSVIAMTARQVCGIGLNLGGSLVITRLLGPAEYGVFGGASRLYLAIFSLFQLGTAVHMVKFEPQSPLGRDLIGTATSTLALTGALAAAAITLCAPFVSAWTRTPQIATAVLAMAWLLPLSMATLVPQAMLERTLSFRGIAKAELLATVVNYAVAIPLALRGWGFGAALGGWMAQQAALSVALHVLARHWPALSWHPSRARELWSFGWRYSLSIAIWQGRNLAVPLLVSRYAGATGLGYVTLAQKIVDTISFPRTVAYRLAVSVLAKLRARGSRLSALTERAMIAQVLLVGLLSAVVASTGTQLAEGLLGPRWVAMMQVFRPLAIAGIVNCAFHLQCSALYVSDRADLVNWFNLANTAVLLGVAISAGPSFGINGYLAAELAALVSYVLLLVLTKRSIALDYPFDGLLWLAAAVVATASAGLGLGSCLILALPILFARGRAELRSLAEMIRHPRNLRLVPESH